MTQIRSLLAAIILILASIVTLISVFIAEKLDKDTTHTWLKGYIKGFDKE